MKTARHFWSYLPHYFLEWEMFPTKVVGEIKTHILCSVTFFLKSCRLWDNVEKICRAGRATDDNTIWLMLIACWIPKATHTRSQCNFYCFSTTTMAARTSINVILYAHCLHCMFNYLYVLAVWARLSSKLVECFPQRYATKKWHCSSDELLPDGWVSTA